MNSNTLGIILAIIGAICLIGIQLVKNFMQIGINNISITIISVIGVICILSSSVFIKKSKK